MDIYLTQFLTIILVHFLAVVSPGPDFAVVVKHSVSYGRKTAIMTSLGVGTGILIHVAYSLLGIGFIISKSILAFSIMKYLGAGYILYIGIKALRSKPSDEKTDLVNKQVELPSSKNAFMTGFMTNGLNPKATLFFLSLFTVIIKHDTPMIYQFSYGIYMAFATFVWFTFVSIFFSQDKVRKTFNRVGHWFDRVMGGVLILLGIKLATSELR